MTSLRRALPMVLIAGLLPLALFQAPSSASTFTVTRTDDPAPGGCQTNDCSLREAIQAANNHAGADVIQLGSGFHFLSIAGTGENGNQEGDLDIEGKLEIVGNGAANTEIDGNDLDRVLHIEPGSEVTISKLTVTNGLVVGAGGGILNGAKLTLRNVIVSDSDASSGGGISNLGNLTMINSRVTDNFLPDSCCGGGIQNRKTMMIKNSRVDHNVAPQCCGGGLYNTEGGDVTITNSKFDNNHAPECCGGGLLSEDEGSTVVITNSVITKNSVTECCGGGLYNDGGSVMTVRRSKVTNNVADFCCGGGVYADGGGVTITDTLIKDNGGPEATGGGAFVEGEGGVTKIIRSALVGNDAEMGGGIHLEDSGRLKLVNTTLSGNSASVSGGAINATSGVLNVMYSTIAENVSPVSNYGINADGASVLFKSSIVALNTPTDCGSTPLGVGLNMDGDSSCFTGADALHGNPMFGTFGNNGGSTPNYALLGNSPAVDEVPGADCPPPKTDQRKVKRPQDGDGNGSKRCDLGSHERK